ncbi:toll/interleukin-1 receptor domain-containing protein [Streptomyces sp. CA-106110]|uniref:toll/interleukin-1 receptor domain-containing protein n=1 Tax=Streptomyces sp. CA-106110 TaxID=3240044 RepID=UPI003D941866
MFLSYAAEDAAWARMLAAHLAGHGVSLFFDQWSIEPGDVVVHKVDAALLTAAHGIAVISPASARSPEPWRSTRRWPPPLPDVD